MNGGLCPWIPHEKIYEGTSAQMKTTRRKEKSTKQFIKTEVTLSRWESEQVLQDGISSYIVLGLDIIGSLQAGRSCGKQWGGL